MFTGLHTVVAANAWERTCSSGQAATYTIAAREAWGRTGCPGPLQGRLYGLCDVPILNSPGHTFQVECLNASLYRGASGRSRCLSKFKFKFKFILLFPISCAGSKSAEKLGIKTVGLFALSSFWKCADTEPERGTRIELTFHDYRQVCYRRDERG